MFRIAVRCFFLLAVLTSALLASAQFTTPDQANQQAKPVDIPNKAPDLVCFGEGPDWSIQFVQGRARNIGINEPDSFFVGKFVWVPNEKIWEWAGNNANGNGGNLSATIQKATCVDTQRKQQFPYKAQVNLPAGDMVNGCCRKLKPGEAAVGSHGYTPPSQ